MNDNHCVLKKNLERGSAPSKPRQRSKATLQTFFYSMQTFFSLHFNRIIKEPAPLSGIIKGQRPLIYKKNPIHPKLTSLLLFPVKEQ